MVPPDETITVPDNTTARAIEPQPRHRALPLPVTDHSGQFIGLVHIREAMRATTIGADQPPGRMMGEAVRARSAIMSSTCSTKRACAIAWNL